LLIPLQYAGAVIGSEASVLRGILRSSNAKNIVLETLPRPTPPSYTERMVQIKGTVENVAAAYREMSAVLEKEAAKVQVASPGVASVPLSLLIHEELVGHVIGKQGVFINKLKALCSGGVNMSPCTHPGLGHLIANFRVFKCEGSPEQLQAVQTALHEKLAKVIVDGHMQLSNPLTANFEDSVSLYIPDGMIGAVIGRGGTVVKEIHSRSRAKIEIDGEADGDGDRGVHISGTVDCVETALNMVGSCLPDDGRYMHAIISVPIAGVGHVIGKGGVKINEIMELTHTKIRVAQTEGEDSAQVSIMGTAMNQVTAQRLVRRIIDEQGLLTK